MTPDSRTPEIHNHRRRRRRPSSSPPAPLPSSSLSIVSAVKRICALVSLSAVFSSISSSPLADAAIAIPVTTNFRFDGTHSDMAQQYYLRWLAGDQVAPLSQYNNGGLPTEVDAFLHQQSVRWLELPGLMQRAILWDLGFVITTESKLVRVSVRCGRSMADIFVPRKAYERIGCLPKACSVPTGELFYRHNTCEDFQAAKISLCAVDFDGGQIHSAMWGDGAVEDDIPDISLARHSWGDNSLMYSIHTNGDDAAYNFCPSTPSVVIPCAPLSREKDQSKWCVPERGVIVEPWIQNFGDSKRPKHGWIMIEFVFFMMLVGSTVFGLHDMVKNKKMRKIRELELQEALLADFANRRQRQDSRASASGDPDAEVLERALDAAAFDHFESSIAMTASAHFDSFSSSLKTLETRPKGNSIGSAGTGSGSSSSDVSSADVHLLELSLEDARRSRRFDRSISASSSISLLSGHRSQVAIRSFHLFESHRPICRKRVAFRDIQFKSILSRGTTGEVWLATLRGSYVAVKQLVPTKRRVLKEMEMFMAEIYLLSQLSHPNIVQLVGVAWNTLEHVVMVQDWMQRGDLQQFLASRRPSNPEDPETPWSGGDASSFSSGELSQHPAYRTHRSLDPALELDLDRDDDVSFCWKSHKLEIARSIAKALLYLHSLTPQLLHRDVKSKNVLLSDAMEVKLCDFGISRRKHHMDESDTNLTVTAAAGTMSWTAPEVLLGEDYGEKVDIYSYGILLCEVDTCVLPYHDPASLAARLIYHPLRLMKQVIGSELRPAISPSCPPRIVKLIHACLDRDPEKRPAAYEIVEYLGHGDERV